jgi:hypothetical protein
MHPAPFPRAQEVAQSIQSGEDRRTPKHSAPTWDRQHALPAKRTKNLLTNGVELLKLSIGTEGSKESHPNPEGDQTMKTLKSTLAALAIGALAAGTANAQVIFEDTFTNDIPANSDVNGSDTIVGFWGFEGTTGATQNETGGTLSLTTGTSASADRLNNMSSQNSIAGANFFDNEITFTADVSLGGTVAVSGRAMRFSVAEGSGYDFADGKDFFRIEITESTNIFAASRVNGTNNTLVAVTTANAGKFISNVSLTLNATEYDFTLTFTDTTTLNYNGNHSLTEASWGSNFHVSMLALKKGTTNTNTTLNVDNYQIIPEPATWVLLAAGLTTVVVFRRRRLS